MSKKLSYILLGCICLFTLLLHVFKHNDVPACINVDEAAFGYNAYSLVQTGRDEYGKYLPLRFKSFGENKLPVVIYFTAPFVAVLGLNDFTTRALPNLAGILMPIFVFFLVKELFDNRKIAIIAAALAGVSPWIQVTARHISESVVATALLTLTFLFFLRYAKSARVRHLVYAAIFFTLALFTHHTPKIFILLFVTWLAFDLWNRKKKCTLSKKFTHLLVFLTPVAFFAYTEAITPTNRIGNLLFATSEGFKIALTELLTENSNRLLYNPLTYSVIYLTNQVLSYLSPSYLVVNGDANPRFWLKGMYPITVIEYLLVLVGIYFLVKNGFKHKFLLLMMALFGVSTAAATSQDPSLTRSFFLIIPLLAVASYGAYYLYGSIRRTSIGKFVLIGAIGAYAFFTIISWDFYFNHYPYRAQVIHAWQCGYEELVASIQKYYPTHREFYITKELGQPYIMLLYYMRYNPATYQRQASLTAPDQYGFGQVEKFDKFEFRIPDEAPPNSIIVAHHNEFADNIDRFSKYKQLESIRVGPSEIFRIYETK